MQAIVMSAYRDFDQLNHLLDMYSEYFNCYVHIDKKASFADDYHLQMLNQKKNVKAISEYKINWGSYYHLLALSRLLGMALEDQRNTRFHIISDTDFPAKAYADFESFFENNTNNYIEVSDISNNPFMQKRYQIFHFQHIFNRKSKNLLEVYTDKVIRNLQYALRIRRKTIYKYKGLVWGSITRQGAEICQKYLSEERINNLKYCETAEEFWLNNALLESPIKDTVVCDNLRYAVWDEHNVNGPRTLSIEDFANVEESNAFFARKVIEGEDELSSKMKEQFCGNIK